MVDGIRSLLKFTVQVYSPFETVIAGRSSIYVFIENPFETIGRIRSLLKFTPQVTSITFKFTAKVTFKFTPQLSRDACNTATPHMAHLMVDLYIYRTMHIYQWQIAPLN